MRPAGRDLRAAEGRVLEANERALIKTGEYNLVPPGYVGLVCTRSGLAMQGIIVLNAPGIVDEDYRGEVGVILMNVGRDRYHVIKGERIAQLVLVECLPWEVEGERGDGGFGSTGRL